MRLRSILAVAVLLSAALVARADTYTTFQLTSAYAGGGAIDGTLTLDTTPTSALFDTFTSADLTASGFTSTAYDGMLTSVGPTGNYFGEIGVNISGSADNTLYLYLATGTLLDYLGSSICSTSSSPACYISDLTGYTVSGPPGAFEASSGTLEPVAPTPEPSSVLLLLTGLFGIAALARRNLLPNL